MLYGQVRLFPAPLALMVRQLQLFLNHFPANADSVPRCNLSVTILGYN